MPRLSLITLHIIVQTILKSSYVAYSYQKIVGQNYCNRVNNANKPPLSALFTKNSCFRLYSFQSNQQAVITKIGPSVVVVGAGPSGLLTAIMLAKRGWNHVKVFDRLNKPDSADSESWGNPERSYNIGIGGRGQKALRAFGVMERFERFCKNVNGRIDWSPESPEGRYTDSSKTKKYVSKVIQRDRLTSVLYEEILEKYPNQVQVEFNAECQDVSWSKLPTEHNILTFRRKTPLDQFGSGDIFTESADVIVAADGVNSAVRSNFLKDEQFLRRHKQKAVRFPERNTRVYKTVPLYLPDSWRKDVNYSARTKSGINIDALPTKEGGYVGVVLFKPENTLISDLKDAAEAKALFQTVFPQFADFIMEEDYAAFVNKNVSRLPEFTYFGPVLHRDDDAVCVGDTIHTVKPYFGLGANSAFEDILVLNQCLDSCNNNLKTALPLYTKQRAKNSEVLVKISRSLDGGFFEFVAPLILDSVFHKIAPRVFGPNTIAMLQREDLTFIQVQRKKRIDRSMQVALLVSLFIITLKAVVFAVGIIKNVSVW